MITITEGNETITVPVTERSPETGDWERVGDDTMLARDMAWRRLQAGQNVVGGHFTAPAGQKVTIPGPVFDWLRFSHRSPAPIQIRWVAVPADDANIRDLQDSDEITLYAWDTVTERGLALHGSLAEFRAGSGGGRLGGATDSVIQVEWYSPDAREADVPTASEPRLVADGSAVSPEESDASATPDKPLRAEEDESDANPTAIDPDEPADTRSGAS